MFSGGKQGYLIVLVVVIIAVIIAIVTLRRSSDAMKKDDKPRKFEELEKLIIEQEKKRVKFDEPLAVVVNKDSDSLVGTPFDIPPLAQPKKIPESTPF